MITHIFVRFICLKKNLRLWEQIWVLRSDSKRVFFKYLREFFFIKKWDCSPIIMCQYTPTKWYCQKENWHLLEVACSLMFISRMLKHFCGEASYLISHMATCILNFQTPLSAFIQIYPQTKLFTSLPLKTFGCAAFVHVHNHLRSKLHSRVVKFVFLGYSPNKKECKCYDPASKKLFVTFDITFFENRFFFPKLLFRGRILWNISFGNLFLSLLFKPECPTWATTFISSPNSSMPQTVIERQVVDEVQHPKLCVYSRQL